MNLYEVIRIGEAKIIVAGDRIDLRYGKLLLSTTSRDVLCAAQNYTEYTGYAEELLDFGFGFGSSDEVSIRPP